MEGDEHEGWENYTVGPVAGGRSEAVVPPLRLSVPLTHTLQYYDSGVDFTKWVVNVAVLDGVHRQHRRRKRSSLEMNTCTVCARYSITIIRFTCLCQLRSSIARHQTLLYSSLVVLTVTISITRHLGAHAYLAIAPASVN